MIRKSVGSLSSAGHVFLLLSLSPICHASFPYAYSGFRFAFLFPAMFASGVGPRQLDQKSSETYTVLEDRNYAAFLMDPHLPLSSNGHPRQKRDMDVLFVTPDILEESFVYASLLTPGKVKVSSVDFTPYGIRWLEMERCAFVDNSS
ncbi:hypothetical protein DENSPDRAFT_851798 [Dentipellis sp. KUC8613]|nr:hypothetical protein DENSPDRAFT_851798 [Dentipellis sp. KUC8613]